MALSSKLFNLFIQIVQVSSSQDDFVCCPVSSTTTADTTSEMGNGLFNFPYPVKIKGSEDGQSVSTLPVCRTSLYCQIRAWHVALEHRMTLRSSLFCPTPSLLSRRHPPHLRAGPDFARRNQVSRCTSTRSALQRSGASHQVLRVPACGELLCFRRQFPRLLNGFRFLRIYACSDLSSFTCVRHIFMVSHSAMQDVSVLQVRILFRNNTS